MALDTASASPEAPAPPARPPFRPRLWVVFAGFGAAAFLLSVAGLAALRVYDSQLIRQAESELIAQGLVVAQVYRTGVAGRVDPAYGNPVTEAWPFPVSSDSALLPVLPTLSARAEVLPAIDEAAATTHAADPVAAEVGHSLADLLSTVAHSSLASIRVVDPTGVVVASSSGAEMGAALGDRPEVRAALGGRPSSALRTRRSQHSDAPLESISRNAGVRVWVALPVLGSGRVWGAVVLGRTPMTVSKAFYADRQYLLATGLLLLAVITLLSLAAATWVVRPVQALARQAAAIVEGDPRGYRPIERPVVAELAQLSAVLADMAQKVHERNHYIRSFAANVSHEFKTPLTSIQGSIELLQSPQSMTEEQRLRFLGNIEADAQRLNRLVEKLLELARADALVPTPERAEVGEILRGISGRAAAANLNVALQAPPGPLMAAVPAEVLDTAVWQLVTNARQHGGEGVSVALSAEVGGGAIRVQVGDDGRGISDFNRARIFDAFFTTARERGGTGLGLPIARSLLRAYGGTLDLVPRSPPGCLFEIVLPQA